MGMKQLLIDVFGWIGNYEVCARCVHRKQHGVYTKEKDEFVCLECMGEKAWAEHNLKNSIALRRIIEKSKYPKLKGNYY